MTTNAAGEQTVVLRDGRRVRIRRAEPDDAADTTAHTDDAAHSSSDREADVAAVLSRLHDRQGVRGQLHLP